MDIVPRLLDNWLGLEMVVEWVVEKAWVLANKCLHQTLDCWENIRRDNRLDIHGFVGREARYMLDWQWRKIRDGLDQLARNKYRKDRGPRLLDTAKVEDLELEFLELVRVKGPEMALLLENR